MRVALIADNALRDLPGLVLLACRLAREGVTSHLVPWQLRWTELPALAPDFVLLDNQYVSNRSFVESLVSAGIPFGVLDKEGAGRLEEYDAELIREEALRARAKFFCAWGRVQADHLIRRKWYAPDQVRTTGAPRFDFYVPPWRKAVLEASPEAALYGGGALILVNGNFPVANSLARDRETVVRAYVRVYGWEADYVRRLQADEERAMRGLTALANRLARRFPEAVFVYRPHPFERTDTYGALLERRDNLHLVKSGAVQGWILRARALLQRNCTTGIEAAMAGVPALSAAWLPVTHENPREEAAVPCRSEEEMEEAVRRVLEGTYTVPVAAARRQREIIRDWYCGADGRAHERVARCILEAIEKGASRSVRLSRCKALAYGLGRPGLPLRARCLAGLRMAAGLPVEWSFTRRRSVPQTHWAESDKRFDSLSVVNLALEVADCWNGSGSARPCFGVRLARERRDYVVPMHGYSVTLAPERAG